jgi:hypothetical protein
MAIFNSYVKLPEGMVGEKEAGWYGKWISIHLSG